jgi:hypothetical protein
MTFIKFKSILNFKLSYERLKNLQPVLNLMNTIFNDEDNINNFNFYFKQELKRL